MAELREHANHLQQENEHLRTRLEANWRDNSRGPTHPTPPIQQSKGKEPVLPGGSDPSTDDELSSDSSPLPDHHPPPPPPPPSPKLTWGLNPKRGPRADLADLLAARTAEYEERPVETITMQNWPLNICLPDSGVWLHHSRSCNTHSGQPPSCIWLLFQLFGG